MPLTAVATVKLDDKQLKWTCTEFISWAQETYNIPLQRLVVRYRHGCYPLLPSRQLAASFSAKFEICSLDEIDVCFAGNFVVAVPYASTFGELGRRVALQIDAPVDAVKLRQTGVSLHISGPAYLPGRWFGTMLPLAEILPLKECISGPLLDMGYRIVGPDVHFAANDILNMLPDSPGGIIRSMLNECNLDITGVLAQFKMDQPHYQLRVPGRFELLYVRKTKSVVIRMANPKRLRALFMEHMDAFFSETWMRANITSNISISDTETHRGKEYILREIQTHSQYHGEQPLEIVCTANDWTLRRLLAHVAPLGLLYSSNRAAVVQNHSGVRPCMVYTSVRDAERFPDLVQHAAKVFRFASGDNMPAPLEPSAYCRMKEHELPAFMRHLPLEYLLQHRLCPCVYINE